MVSPAVERFLGRPAASLWGVARGDFSFRHPLRQARKPVRRVNLSRWPLPKSKSTGTRTCAAPRRIGVSVQVISEGGTHMGALVVLRDPESRERIGASKYNWPARLTTGVAHEVKNPLNSMRLWLENLRVSLPAAKERRVKPWPSWTARSDRLDSVVKRFLDFTRPVELRREETHLDGCSKKYSRLPVPRWSVPACSRRFIACRSRRCMWTEPCSSRPSLIWCITLLRPCPGGRLTVAIDRRGDVVEISIADTGVGIKPEHRARVFQLFFTTRPGGSGIGLASAYKTVQLHEGSIDFESEPGRGTVFRIELPLTLRASEVELTRSRAVGGVAANKA